MKGMDLPITKTKVNHATDSKYDLNNIQGRAKYFEDKVGPEIAKLREYFVDNTFVAYLLGKKNAGKGTYTKLFAEIFGQDKVMHISVGDLVRETEKVKTDEKERKLLQEYLEKNYRGFMPLDEAITAFFNRDMSKLLPTEFILSIVKRKIDQAGRKVLFIDGFPRSMDQISYSLYFRELINYREDPDLFILIDLPENVIGERIKYRRVCPVCQTSRNTRLLPTSFVGYDKETKQFYLMCDNPSCNKAKMLGKEGDELGIETIRERLEMDDDLIRKALSLHGIPKIFLRNSVPVEIAYDVVENYEITPMYTHTWNEAEQKVETTESEWSVEDDNGIPSYSLLAAPVVLTLIKQLVEVLGL